MDRVIILYIILLSSVSLFSQSISSISGTVSNDSSITISGSSFGNHSLNIEWLGGLSGNIEQGTLGSKFSKTGWTASDSSSSFMEPQYTNERAHSGSKSIKSSYPLESQYGSGFYYDTGGNVDSIYVSWWAYFDHYDSGGQWKKWRIRPSVSVGDTDGEIMQSEWFNVDGSNGQAYVMIFCDANSYAQCYPDSDGEERWIDDPVPKDKWVRLEYYVKESSDAGVRDAKFFYYIHKQSEAVTAIKEYDGTVITRAEGVSDRMRYLHWQNYWGNISGGNRTGEKIYIDDIYISKKTRARVEIGNNSNWASCTHREIQYPTAWSASSITITLNAGTFTSDSTTYLFVVDSDGTASSGYQITFGNTYSSATGLMRGGGAGIGTHGTGTIK